MNRLPIRNAVAYVVADRNHPTAALTIDALEGLGQPLHVVSLNAEPRLSAAIVFTTAMRLLREPTRALRALLRDPVSVSLAQTLRARGITHVHAGDAHAAKIARAVARLNGATFTSGALPPQPAADIPMLALDWSPLRAQSLGVRWMSTRLDNAVAEVAVYGEGAERDVIVKQSFAKERARHEASTLALLESVGAPRVLLFDEERATIVMERASGVSLDRIFASRDAAAIVAASERAGAWLAAMQQHTRSNTDGHALLTSVVEGAVRDADVFRGRERMRIIDRLRKHERSAASRPVAVAGHHGDYWPGNIFVDGARVTVIDFEGFREGLPLEDAAYFLIRTELLARRFRVNVAGLRDAFFRGYSSTPAGDTLELFTITKGLRTLANDTGGNLPLPQRLWTRRTVRNAILRCL